MVKLFLLFMSVLLFPLSIIAGEISYEGSATVGDYLKHACEYYSSSSLSINTSGQSRKGELCSANNECNMGGISRDLSKGIKKRGGVVSNIIGKDLIVLIVNADNPVNELSSAQLESIYTGQTKNWAEVGGPDMPIKPLIAKKGSGTRKIFSNTILDGKSLKEADDISPHEKLPIIVSKVAGGIAPISIELTHDVEGIKILDIDGELACVHNDEYKLSRPIKITTKGEPKGDVKDFIDWTRTEGGQFALKQYCRHDKSHIQN